jgi:hypothetical protein
MPSLTTPLPLEIQLKVFECLAHSKGDLVNISLCSRYFYDLVQPLLYYSFGVSSFSKRLGWDHKRVALFLCQIRLKPHLAQYVKHFNVVAIPFVHIQAGEFHLILSREEDESVRRWVRDALPDEVFGRDFCQQWHDAFFSQKYWDAVVAFIFVVLPNLQAFEIDYNHWGRPRPGGVKDKTPYINMVLKHMAMQQLSALQPKEDISLPRFIKVFVGAALQREEIDLGQVVPFLKLGSLTKLEVNRACQDGVFTHNQEQPSHVKDLTLFECHIGPSTARTFFLSFHFLKIFRFKECGIGPHRGEDGGFTPASVLEGLQNSRHCLEKLELLNNDPGWGLGAARSTDPKSFCPLGSLADFTSLR